MAIKQTSGDGFTLLDNPARYVMRITEATEGRQSFLNRDTNQMEEKPNVKFVYEVLSGPHYGNNEEFEGVTLWYFTPQTFSTHPKCKLMNMVKEVMFGGNFPPADYDLELDHLIGRVVECKVGEWTSKEGVVKNSIDGFKALPDQPVFDTDAPFEAPAQEALPTDETDEIPF